MTCAITVHVLALAIVAAFPAESPEITYSATISPNKILVPAPAGLRLESRDPFNHPDQYPSP